MSQPADWSARFQTLAADAAQLYGKGLRRHQELLDRVAQGALRPEQVQKQFHDYLQQNATRATQDLIELSVALLAGLLHVEALYREKLLDGLLPADGSIAPPPSPSSLELATWFQTLSAYAAEQSARGVARHQALVARIAAGEITPDQVRKQGQQFLATQAPALLGDVMDLGLDFVGRLQRSSASLSEGLYDTVLGNDTSETSTPPEPPVCIDLRGPVGATVSSTLVVENTRRRITDVVCHVSDLAVRGNGRRFRSGLRALPSRFTLAPDEQRDLNLDLTLDPTLFAHGVDYAATLVVAGAGERELIMPILVHVELPATKKPSKRPSVDG